MRFKSALFASALVGAAALTVLPAAGASASASPASAVPLTHLAGFHQILVDDAAGYIFFSQGVGSVSLLQGVVNTAGIVVTNLSGGYVTTLDAGDGAEGLALSSDGGTLYAALTTDDAVGVISAAALKQTAEWPLSSGAMSPYGLALQSGRLWVSYNANPVAADGGTIGDFQLPASSSAGAPAFEVPLHTGGWWSSPDLASDPSDTGVLLASQPQVLHPEAATFNVAVDPRTTIGDSGDICAAYENGIAVYPGGTEFLACNSNISALYMTPDPGGSLPGDQAADAISADGSLYAIASNLTFGGPTVAVFPAGGSTARNEYTFASSEEVTPAGLAFSGDDAKLYVVLENSASQTYSLDVFNNPGTTVVVLPSAPLTVSTSASSLPYGVAAKVTAHLGAVGDVSLYAQTAGTSARKLVASGPVNAAGNLTVSYPVTHNTIFTAVFSGNSTYKATTKTTTVLAGVKISMADRGYFGAQQIGTIGYRLFHHTASLIAEVTVAPDNSGQCVRLEVQRYNTAKKAWLTTEITGCRALSKSSGVSISVPLRTMPYALYRWRADYAPSAGYQGNIATDSDSWLHFKLVM